MKKWLKAAVFCLFPIFFYEGIAFLIGGTFGTVLLQWKIEESGVGMWLEGNAGLLVTGLSGIGAAVCFQLMENPFSVVRRNGESPSHGVWQNGIKGRKNGIKVLEQTVREQTAGEQTVCRQLSWKSVFSIAFLSAVVSVCLNLALSLLPFYQNYADAYERSQQGIQGTAVFLRIAVVCLAAPWGEEWAFRGFAFGRLRTITGFVPAAFLSSLTFACYHGNLLQGIYAFCLGLLMAWARETYGSVNAAFIVHMTANGTALLMAASPF